MTSPKIYLAGKISKENDWRGSVLGETYRPASRDDRVTPAPIDKGPFTYVGPWFTSCDHGCYHGKSSHGVGATDPGCMEMGENNAHRSWAHSECLRLIEDSDLVIAWIDDPTAFGTIAEIGFASGIGKPVYVGFPPESSFADDVWFAASFSAGSVVGKTPEEFVNAALQDYGSNQQSTR